MELSHNLNFEHFIENKKAYYQVYNKKERKGKIRKIVSPSKELKQIQRSFMDAIYTLIDCGLDDSVRGFRRGESVLTNSQDHLNKRILVNIDIKNFFPSIPEYWLKTKLIDLFKKQRIKRYKKRNNLMDIGPLEMFEIITIKGKLPQGSPCSPVFANYYLSDKGFDLRMVSITDWDYTRYADDLSFSTNKDIKRGDIIRSLITPIYKDLVKIDLRPNRKKTKIKFYGQKQLVTGILVNGEKPKIPKDYSDTIRAAIHKKDLDSKTLGSLSYIKSVNNEQYSKLMNIRKNEDESNKC